MMEQEAAGISLPTYTTTALVESICCNYIGTLKTDEGQQLPGEDVDG